MKKIFTLIAVACVAMSANAQDSYRSVVITEGGNITFATEFGSVCEPVMKTVKTYDEEGNETGTEEVVDYYKATNVEDGRVVVDVVTPNMKVQAVGGSVPAKEESLASGAQAILADGTVTQWDDIKWELKNHKTDINDEANTKIYIVNGSGNPFVGLSAVQVSKDGEVVEGAYKADYEFYEPDGSKGLPQVGLYYKFTPQTDGKLKVLIWANKGRRKTFLVPESTKQAITYEVEGYINNNKIVDADGNKVLNAEGKEMMKLLSDADVKAVWQEEFDKAVASAISGGKTEEEALAETHKSLDWVIGHWNQAFWGWLSFDAVAGETYWLFQHSSQIGFGGFEFTSTGSNGIANVNAEDNADAPVFNLAGQRVAAGTKGLLIKNGKKFIVK